MQQPHSPHVLLGQVQLRQRLLVPVLPGMRQFVNDALVLSNLVGQRRILAAHVGTGFVQSFLE